MRKFHNTAVILTRMVQGVVQKGLPNAELERPGFWGDAETVEA